MNKPFSFAEWLQQGGDNKVGPYSLNEAYQRIAWIYACVNRIASTASMAPLTFYRVRRGQIPRFDPGRILTSARHPVYQLFTPPNGVKIPSLSFLLYLTFVHLGINGVIYWVLQRKNGVPVNIDIRTKGQLQPIVSPDGMELFGWQETISTASGEKKTKDYTTADVLAIKYQHPTNLWEGMSPLNAARISVESELSINGWNTSMLKTGMKSPVVVQAKGTMTPQQKEENRKEIRKFYSGIEGAHGALLLQGNLDVKPLQLTQKDIDFVTGKQLNREEIAGIYGVPPALIGIFAYANYCLTSDAVITMADGTTKPIVEIEPGEQVMTMGKERIETAPVVNCWEAGVKDIYRVRTGSRSLKCSPEHKFYHLTAGINPAYPRTKKWVDAKDLKVGDYVAIVTAIPAASEGTLLPNGETATEGGMHQLGLYVGDGDVLCKKGRNAPEPYPMGVRIAIPETDPDRESYIEEARNFWKPGSQYKGRDKVHVGRNKYLYRVCSTLAAKWISDFGFAGNSHTKRVPEWVFGLKPELKKAFLRGVFDSDGHYDKHGRVQIGMCNEELVNDIRDLCIGVGYHVNNVATANRMTNFGEQFIASIVVSFTTGQHSVKEFPNHPLPSGLVWQKIRSIELLEQEPTYDLEIQGTHNYFANWMVTHNSNVTEQIRIFWELTLLPKLSNILDLVRLTIIEPYFPGISAAWDTSLISGLQPNPAEIAAAVDTYVRLGYSPQQVARIFNLPTLTPDSDFDYDRLDAATASPPAQPAESEQLDKQPDAEANNAYQRSPQQRVPSVAESSAASMKRALSDYLVAVTQAANLSVSAKVRLLQDYLASTVQTLCEDFIGALQDYYNDERVDLELDTAVVDSGSILYDIQPAITKLAEDERWQSRREEVASLLVAGVLAKVNKRVSPAIEDALVHSRSEYPDSTQQAVRITDDCVVTLDLFTTGNTEID